MFNPQMTSSQMELLPLVCLCLLSWSGTTSADQHERVVVKQDDDVILKCSLGESAVFKRFEWKKDGQKEVFSYDGGIHTNNGRGGQAEQFKGRVSHFQDDLKHGNASVKITNTKMADSGDYTCDFPTLQPPQTFQLKLFVVVERVVVEQDGDVILPCSINGVNIKSGVFDWTKDGQKRTEVFFYNNGDVYSKDSTGQDEQFRGRVSHFDEDERKNGNASIKIRKAKMADRGIYTCKFPNLQGSPTFNIELVVEPVLKDRTGENITGAASRPFVTILKTQDGVLLQCEVHSASPKPKVEWKDSSGKIPTKEPQVTERGGSYDIILQAPVTKADHYRCVVTQEEINHLTSAEIYVPLNGSESVSPLDGLLLLQFLLLFLLF